MCLILPVCLSVCMYVCIYVLYVCIISSNLERSFRLYWYTNISLRTNSKHTHGIEFGQNEFLVMLYVRSSSKNHDQVM